MNEQPNNNVLDELVDMATHEVKNFKIQDTTVVVIKVPSGWLYEFQIGHRTHIIFIPFGSMI